MFECTVYCKMLDTDFTRVFILNGQATGEQLT